MLHQWKFKVSFPVSYVKDKQIRKASSAQLRDTSITKVGLSQHQVAEQDNDEKLVANPTTWNIGTWGTS